VTYLSKSPKSSDTPERPLVLLESFLSGEFPASYSFEGMEKEIVAKSKEDVFPAFTKIEAAVASGKHVAGFIAYEAANAFNPHYPIRESSSGMPLLWFGIFSERRSCGRRMDNLHACDYRLSSSSMDIEKSCYIDAVGNIRDAIADGKTYQVNFSLRKRFNVSGDFFGLYRNICRNQPASFCAWLDTGSDLVLSASPELFFSLKENILTMKPMKGTAGRMPLLEDDCRQRLLLPLNPKERAENLMIVDMVRNDLGMIAENGSVNVSSLFDVETYPTLHQMTSTVKARIPSGTDFFSIFKALFPSASVTGAPKKSAMEMISALEDEPRSVYCGAIGYFSPGPEAVFSVAIRTLAVKKATGEGVAGIGSGVTWDSDPCAEFSECLNKSDFIFRDSTPFKLVESIRYDRYGYHMLERHLRRLSGSADYFGICADMKMIDEELSLFAVNLTGDNKVRIAVDQSGGFEINSTVIPDSISEDAITVARLSRNRVDSSDIFLYHKSTRRTLYNKEMQLHPECYDILFLNEREELTEGTFNNIVLSIGGELFTPPVRSGLLPGVLRAVLIESGEVAEKILTVEDIYKAEKIWLINSVRGWRECRFLF